jgi:hypothetical protein
MVVLRRIKIRRGVRIRCCFVIMIRTEGKGEMLHDEFIGGQKLVVLSG